MRAVDTLAEMPWCVCQGYDTTPGQVCDKTLMKLVHTKVTRLKPSRWSSSEDDASCVNISHCTESADCDIADIAVAVFTCHMLYVMMVHSQKQLGIEAMGRRDYTALSILRDYAFWFRSVSQSLSVGDSKFCRQLLCHFVL